MTSNRVSKASLIEFLRSRVNALRQDNAIDAGNGTAQLRPKTGALAAAPAEEMEALIDRCVAYGRAQAMELLADQMDEGALASAIEYERARVEARDRMR